MKEILKSHHPMRRAQSFKYAFEGLFHALLHEANFQIQVLIATISVALGFYFKISNTEWGMLALSMGFLLSAEMINTVIEEFIDHLIIRESPVAKLIKDLGAGFVLVASFATLFILILIFGGRISELFIK